MFSYSNYKFERLKRYNSKIKLVVPIAVTGGAVDFTLFAIWANNPNDKDGQYVTQVWKAIHYYSKHLTPSTLLAGDFNSNTIWDKPRRKGNHSTVVNYLQQKGIHSTYHAHHKQIQGKEKHPTYFLYRHKNKPYHLDYCFASDDFMRQLKSVKIGSYKQWAKYSDHVPVIATFEL